jgi:hypothetical protein
MKLIAKPDAGLIFSPLDALFPRDKCMDDGDIASEPGVWADNTRIVTLSGQTMHPIKVLHCISCPIDTLHNCYVLSRGSRFLTFSCLIRNVGLPKDT